MQDTMNKRSGKFEKAVFQSPQHKMGVKVLAENQLSNVFPSYDNLIDRISSHREYVKNQRERIRQLVGKIEMDGQYNMMFDNVFSIMGKRGSGKTSAVYTLKKMFEDISETDVVLPIVISELIPDSSDTIGWILALLEDTVQNISKQLSEKRVSSDMFKACRIKEECILKEIYEKVKELSYSKSYDTKGDESFSKAVFNFERRTQNSFDFSCSIAQFWSELVNSIRVVHSLGDNEEPLIYVIFDDVDLTPERVWELLSTIVKYLSHPNVVVIVTAEEKMLYSVVKNILYIKMKNNKVRREIVSHNNTWFEEMAKLYVDKILPPSTRYYIENFKTCERKSSFITKLEFTSGGKIGNTVCLQNFLEGLISDYLGANSQNEKNDFLHYNGEFITAYFIFWGETSRQLCNQCFIVEEFINTLKKIHEKSSNVVKKKEYISELFHAIYYFIFSTLNANNKISTDSTYIKKLVDKIVVLQPEGWEIYLDYNYLYERFEEVLNNDPFTSDAIIDLENNENNSLLCCVKENIILYMLLFFVENILLVERERFSDCWENHTGKIHGQYTLVSMLDKITPKNYSLVRRDSRDLRLQKFLSTYGILLEKPEIVMEFDISNVSKVRQYLESLKQNTDEISLINQYSVENPKWFRSMVKILYLSKMGIYNITQSMLFDSYINRRRNICDKGIEMQDREELQLIYDYLSQPSNYICQISKNNKEPDTEFNEIQYRKHNSSIEVIKQFKMYEEPKNNVVKNAKYYLYLLSKVVPDEDLNEFEELVKQVEKKGTEFITSKIMDVMQRISTYRILDISGFRSIITDIEAYLPIFFDWAQIEEKPTGFYIEIGYFNYILNSILKEAAKRSEMYGYMREKEYQLKEAHMELSNKVCIAMLAKDKKNTYELLVLKRFHMYMKIIELSKYIDSNNNKTEQLVLKCLDSLYENLYDGILDVAKGKSGNAYLKSLVNDCISEGVKEYINRLSGED